MTFVDVVLYLLKKEQKTPYRKMENQTYKLKDTFTITNECPNQFITKMVIKEVKTECGEEKYKLTSYFSYLLVDGSIKKEQSSKWYNAQSINIMINEFRSIVKSN